MMIVVFLVYSAAVMLFGIIMSKGKDSTGADFLLAGVRYRLSSYLALCLQLSLEPVQAWGLLD